MYDVRPDISNYNTGPSPGIKTMTTLSPKSSPKRNPVFLLFFFVFFTSRKPYQKKKGGGCARDWCVGRGSLLQDGLPVKFQDVKFTDPKFNMKFS